MAWRSSMWWRTFLVALAALLFLVAAVAEAQPARRRRRAVRRRPPVVTQTETDQPPPEALRLFESARDLYRAGRYPEAADELERALVLDPDAPSIMSSLARVYELSGRYGDALEMNRRLLVLIPETQAADRTRIEETIQRLEGAQRLAVPPPPAQQGQELEIVGPTYVRERGVADDAFWGTVALGGIAGVTAILAGTIAGLEYSVLARTKLAVVDDPESGSMTYLNYQVRHRGIRIEGLVADIAGGLSLVGFGVAAVLYLTREDVYELWPDGHRTRRRRMREVVQESDEDEEEGEEEVEEEESSPSTPWYQRSDRSSIDWSVSPLGASIWGTF